MVMAESLPHPTTTSRAQHRKWEDGVGKMGRGGYRSVQREGLYGCVGGVPKGPNKQQKTPPPVWAPGPAAPSVLKVKSRDCSGGGAFSDHQAGLHSLKALA